MASVRSSSSDREPGRRLVVPLPGPNELYPIFQGTLHLSRSNKRKLQFPAPMDPDFAMVHSYKLVLLLLNSLVKIVRAV